MTAPRSIILLVLYATFIIGSLLFYNYVLKRVNQFYEAVAFSRSVELADRSTNIDVTND